MARVKVTDDRIEDLLDDEAGALDDEALAAERPSIGVRLMAPKPRTRARGSSAASAPRKRASHPRDRKPAASRAAKPKDGPVIEWGGELLARALEIASLRASAGRAPMEHAEARGVITPLLRLATRHLLPNSVIDIGIPTEDKRDLSLLLSSIGRYVVRVARLRWGLTPQQMNAIAQMNARAQAQYEAQLKQRAEPEPEPVTGAPLDADAAGDELQAAYARALAGFPEGGSNGAPGAPGVADVADDDSGALFPGDGSTPQGAGAPPVAPPPGGSIEALLRAGVLPNYNGLE